MRVEDIAIPEIVIGERRRDDYGNVQELADSINARHMTHPRVKEDVMWQENNFNGEENHSYSGSYKALNLKQPSVSIHPSLLPDHWHVAVFFMSHKIVTAYPEWKEKIPAWLRRQGVNPEYYEWKSEPAEPLEHNPHNIEIERPKQPRLRLVKLPEPKPCPPFVYFIQAGDGGLIKIGRSNNPDKRLQSLKTASAATLKPLGVLDGDGNLELALHGRFKHLRQHGEWFSPDPELLDFISQNAKAWATFHLTAAIHELSEMKRLGIISRMNPEGRAELLADLIRCQNELSKMAAELQDFLDERAAIAS